MYIHCVLLMKPGYLRFSHYSVAEKFQALPVAMQLTFMGYSFGAIVSFTLSVRLFMRSMAIRRPYSQSPVLQTIILVGSSFDSWSFTSTSAFACFWALPVLGGIMTTALYDYAGIALRFNTVQMTRIISGTAMVE